MEVHFRKFASQKATFAAPLRGYGGQEKVTNAVWRRLKDRNNSLALVVLQLIYDFCVGFPLHFPSLFSQILPLIGMCFHIIRNQQLISIAVYCKFPICKVQSVKESADMNFVLIPICPTIDLQVKSKANKELRFQ